TAVSSVVCSVSLLAISRRLYSHNATADLNVPPKERKNAGQFHGGRFYTARIEARFLESSQTTLHQRTASNRYTVDASSSSVSFATDATASADSGTGQCYSHQPCHSAPLRVFQTSSQIA